jgi:hypothetical protein
VLQILTCHHCYTAVLLRDNLMLLWGHPEICPRPVTVSIAGSTWGGTMLKTRFLGRGMRLEFHHPAYRTPIVTSPIQEIVERRPNWTPRSSSSSTHLCDSSAERLVCVSCMTRCQGRRTWCDRQMRYMLGACGAPGCGRPVRAFSLD